MPKSSETDIETRSARARVAGTAGATCSAAVPESATRMAAAAEAYSMASRDLAKELRFGGVERLVRAESYHATSYPPLSDT